MYVLKKWYILGGIRMIVVHCGSLSVQTCDGVLAEGRSL